MLGGVELRGTPEESIVVQTRLGKPVANAKAPDPSDQCRRVFERLVHRHPAWLVRRTPTGIYNCAGHVWASRRTAIYEQEAWEQVLREDGYRQRQGFEHPTVGDLVIYRDGPSQSLLHVGQIVELRRLEVGQEQAQGVIPWVLSKLGPTSGEVLHHFQQAPYEQFEASISYWTEIPL
jgi:hypothetical protein